MVTNSIRRVGRFTIRRGTPFLHMAVIAGDAANAFFRLRFFNTACYRAMIRQVYSIAVQGVPITVFIALVVGSITVHYLLSVLTGLGAYHRIGDYLIAAMLHQIAPVSVAIILMIRSGTAAISELSLMHINKEWDTLHLLRINAQDYIHLPRLIGFLVAGPSLTLVFSITALLGGFLILGYMQDITFANYLDQITDAFKLSDVFYLLAKPAILAVAVGLVSIQRGMNMQVTTATLPRTLIRGQMYMLIMIVTIEVFFAMLG